MATSPVSRANSSRRCIRLAPALHLFVIGSTTYAPLRAVCTVVAWDEDRPEWGTAEHEFATAWRTQPKWVASRSLTSVGPNATLVGDDLEAFVRRLKNEVAGVIDVAGPDLAASLTRSGLIDEYHLYFRPFVLGRGKPYFAEARPPLRLVGTDHVGKDAIRLTFVSA